MATCPDCGAGLGAEQNFCRECGADVSDVETGDAAEASPTETETSQTTSHSNHGHIPNSTPEYVTPARVRKIADILDDGEPVHHLTRGSTVDVEGSSAGTSLFGDDRSRKTGTSGYVRAAITDKRVVIKIPQVLGSDERSVPYRNITSVDLDTGFVTKRLSLQTPGQTYHIEAHEPDKQSVREAVSFIRDQTAKAQTQGNNGPANDPDPTEQLQNLKELYDEGVVTEEEFESKKQDLLDQI